MECAKKYRRQGIASMFLNILAKEADKANNVLVLFPAEDWMLKWYSRFGFKTIQESPVIMARKPLTAVMRQDKHDDRNN